MFSCFCRPGIRHFPVIFNWISQSTLKTAFFMKPRGRKICNAKNAIIEQASISARKWHETQMKRVYVSTSHHDGNINFFESERKHAVMSDSKKKTTNARQSARERERDFLTRKHSHIRLAQWQLDVGRHKRARVASSLQRNQRQQRGCTMMHTNHYICIHSSATVPQSRIAENRSALSARDTMHTKNYTTGRWITLWKATTTLERAVCIRKCCVARARTSFTYESREYIIRTCTRCVHNALGLKVWRPVLRGILCESWPAAAWDGGLCHK